MTCLKKENGRHTHTQVHALYKYLNPANLKVGQETQHTAKHKQHQIIIKEVEKKLIPNSVAFDFTPTFRGVNIYKAQKL